MIKIDESNLQIKNELIHLTFSNTSSASLALFINIIIVDIAFWSISNQYILSIWSLSISILLIMRTLLAKSFLKNPSKSSLETAEKHFKRYTLLSVIIFITGILIILPKNLPFHQAFLTMIVAGLASGAVMSLSFYKNLIQNYLIILLLPFIYIIYIQDTQVHTLIAILMILFLFMLILFSKKYYANIVDVIGSKILIQKSQKELKLSQDRFSTIFEQAPVGIFTYNNELIIQELNQEVASMLKTTYKKLIHLEMKQLPDQAIRPALDIVLKGEKGFYEGIYHTKISDEDIWISMQTVPIYDTDENIQGGLAIVTDITQRIESEKKIRHQAFYDHLTGLANRITFNERLEQQLSRLSRHNRLGAVLFIDLDHFKTINDSLGHHVGDILLQTFATRASSSVRKEDTLARLGGDEFVILLSDLSDNEMHTTELAHQLATKIHTLMKTPIIVEQHTLHISVSIGITLIGSKEQSISDILKHADIAMYEAKLSGRNTTRIFEKEMSLKIQKQLILENELRQAIKHNQFELYYQPIVNTKNSKIISCEALIRWNHPINGLVFPDEFIPYAEESGLIIPIGDWVIESACKDYKQYEGKLKKWASRLTPPIHI